MTEDSRQETGWRQGFAKNWPPEARLIGAYLVSGPVSNRIGCFLLDFAELAEQTGIAAEKLTDIIAILSQDGFARYDVASGWVWLPDVLRQHPFADSEDVRRTLAELAAVPRDAPFRPDLVQAFRASADRPGAARPAEKFWLRGLIGDHRAADLAARLSIVNDKMRRQLPGLPSLQPAHLQPIAQGMINILDYLRRCRSFLFDLVDTRALHTLGILLVILAILFVVFPGIDLGVASWFYVPPRHFTLGETWVGRVFDEEIHFAMEWFLVLLVGVFLYGLIRKRVFWNLTPKNFLFVVLSIGLGAGVMTNVVFKDSWGRARPSQVLEFGGAKQFSPAFMRSKQCDKNCSFVSGDASLAASFLAFAVIAQRNRRRWWVGLSAFTVLVGLMRMGRGSHFLSDVVFAIIFTLMVMLVLARLILDDRWREWPRWRNSAKEE
ncbi:MAG: Phosphoesterase PA-phosphatase related protein [Rhodospirillales bacterium]|nr:Phosphoesterase PA-phosphatase related protein [Rhodospirillales bacterium]